MKFQLPLCLCGAFVKNLLCNPAFFTFETFNKNVKTEGNISIGININIFTDIVSFWQWFLNYFFNITMKFSFGNVTSNYCEFVKEGRGPRNSFFCVKDAERIFLSHFVFRKEAQKDLVQSCLRPLLKECTGQGERTCTKESVSERHLLISSSCA